MNKIKELYAYREMIASLVKRELRGRYKGAVLGFLWNFLNPLLQLIVYTLVFSVIMRAGIEKYYIFLFVALVPWIFFSSALTSGSSCILSNQDLVKKIYFPREVLPIAHTTATFVNMLLSFIVVFGVLIVTGFGINPVACLFLPVIMIVEYIICLGMCMIFSALTVYVRDMQNIMAIVAMAWQFLTPVMYGQQMVEGALANHPVMMTIWNYNPTTPLINAYRQILYYKEIPDMRYMGMALLLGIAVCVIGWCVFEKLQKGFAEEL